MIGETVAHYRVLAQLGEGGMGVVYEAEDLRLRRRVALKFLAGDAPAAPDALERLRREARAASSLNHPGICTIHDVDEHRARPFIAMELLTGQTLKDRLASRRLTLDELLDLALQIADALGAAHEQGILHRDLKPANVFVTQRGQAKILDFGLATLVRRGGGAAADELASQTTADARDPLAHPGTLAGTAAYMSPEQVRGEELDTRSDLFSFGVILYEMATGQRPFSGRTPGLVHDAVLNRAPLPPRGLDSRLPEDLERIIHKALEKDRETRYQSAADLGADLKRAKRDALARPPAGREASTRRRASSRPRKAVDSLAVLPFANLSGDPTMDYLSEGITESLIDSLSLLPRLRVLPRSSVSRYRAREPDLKQVARELEVRAALTGSVSLRAESLVVKTELVDLEQDAQLWGDRYSRMGTDILAVEREIAGEIAGALRLQLRPDERKRLAKRHTRNIEAYHAYLKGRHRLNSRTPEGIATAVECFREAVERDPSYALAYTGMADAYALCASTGHGGLAPGDAIAKARAAAAKAVEIDELLAEGHTSLAFICFRFDWLFAQADGQFQRALELQPRNAASHHWYAIFLAAMGRSSEAMGQIEQARQLDPLSPIIATAVGRVLHYARRFEQAISEYGKTLAMDPDFAEARFGLGVAYTETRRFAEAIVELREADRLVGQNPLYMSERARAHALAGQPSVAQELLGQLKTLAISSQVSAYDLAVVHLALGDRPAALSCLKQAYETRATAMPYLKVDPAMDGLRSDPTFQDLLRRVGFPAAAAT
jgi:serine/threonine protein kinase/Flp pilus assembly protein TadD